MRIRDRVRNWLVGGSTARDYLDHDTHRLREYRRFFRAYRGYKTANTANASYTAADLALAGARLRFNFNRPIVNLGAAFLAAGAVKWQIAVKDNDELSEAASNAAFDIWDRSGSDRSILKAARTCGIYGDMVGIAAQGEDARARIQFVAPDICNPTFAGSDASKLIELQISWTEETRDGERVTTHEFYTDQGREVYKNDADAPEEFQEWARMPAVWIRNLELLGESYGISDLDGIVELTEAYDHTMTKREAMIDYAADPAIIAKSLKPSTTLQKDLRTVWYVGENGDMKYLEWTGSPPDVAAQLTDIRSAIEEVSQVPAVAFGKQEAGSANVSGVALRILYGPLLAKTEDKRANWGPALEYLMWLCLGAEGYEVPLESVNIQWPDPVPEDALALLEEEKGAVDAGLRSKRTAMANLGTEDPDGELEKILEESRKAQQATAPTDRREALRQRVEQRRAEGANGVTTAP